MPRILNSRVARGLRVLCCALLMGFVLSSLLSPHERAHAASGWNVVYTQSSELHGVFALNSSNAWVVGANGTILHWDGTTWTKQDSGVLGALWAVYALDSNHIWVVGDNGTVLFSNNNGTSWSLIPTGLTSDNLWGVYATSTSDVWVLGGKDGAPSSGVILHSDGTQWSVSWRVQNSPTDVGMNSAWGPDANHIWAVGNGGRILFWNGASWTEQQSGVNTELSSITALSPSNIWVSGRNGVILHYNGSIWTKQNSGVTGYVTSVSAADPSHIWASVQKLGTAPGSTILFGNGSGWSPQGSLTSDMHAIFALNSSYVLAAGMDGNVYAYSDVPATAIRLTSPNGGQTYNSGSTTRVTWEAPPEMVRFKLKLSKDDGLTWSVITGAESLTQQFFDWQVPALAFNSSTVKIKVTGFNSGGANIGSDASDLPFRIVVVNLSSPNGGAEYRSGGGVQIRWNTYSTIAPVAKTKLQYSKDGGVTWNLIQSFNGTQSSYNWTIPAVLKSKPQCLVRVVLKDAGNRTIGKDASDNYFALKPQ